MLLGCVFYTIGLLCRAFPNHALLALLSGAMTGLGLSLADLVQQTLLLMMDDQQRQHSLFWSNQLLTVARSAGAFISGWLLLLLDPLWNNAYQGILLLSAIFAFQALWIVPSTPVILQPESAAEASNTSCNLRELLRVHGWLTIQFVSAIFLIGFNLTVLLPIFPLYLKQLSLSPATIGTMTSLGLLFGSAVQFLYTHHLKGTEAVKDFMVIAILTAILLFLFFYGIQQRKTIGCIACLITFYTLRALSGLLIRLIQLTLVDKTLTLALLSLAQTALVCGELAGSIGLPCIYNHALFIHYPLFPALISICSALLLYRCQLRTC
jgi:hypothetical protein